MTDRHVPIDEDKLLTAKDLAKILGVDTRTLSNWIKENGLPFIRIGTRTRRFRRSAVESWLKDSSYSSELSK
jgi:excisionase family DNA binding protein